MNQKVLYKIQVSGRVQGVGFRHAARTQARYNGIRGIVKNLENGDVYIEAEGSRNQLDDFVAWVRKGPGFGFVESITVDFGPPVNYENFTIVY